MRMLFVVDSFFQFIVATNLKLTEFKNDRVDVIIYDTTNNAEVVYENAKKFGIFENCYFAQTPMLFCGKRFTKTQKLRKYIRYTESLCFPKLSLSHVIKYGDFKYDILLFNSYGAMTDCIFNVILKENPMAVCYRYEEGFGSYFNEFNNQKSAMRIKIESVIRGLFGNVNIENYIERFYFFEPDFVMFNPRYKIVKMPKISRENEALKDILNRVFDYTSMKDNYAEKFIVFEDGGTYFGGGSEDLDLIKIIVETVGKENVFVKTHPRSKENRFAPLGIKTNETTSIPWEVIQMNNRFDGKVFVTTASASALSSCIYFGDDAKIIMLYGCMNDKPKMVNANFHKYIEKFKEKYGNETLLVPKTREELVDILEHLKN